MAKFAGQRRGVFGGAGVGPAPADIERGPSIFTALQEQG